jgi:peptidoglycan hydrolase CwlO-like protein
MKRITTTLSAFVATLLISVLPSIAFEGSMGTMRDQGQQGQKDECLIVARNCGNDVDSIQERIQRLQGEIARGTDAYTPGELKILNHELEDANETLVVLQTNGGA